MPKTKELVVRLDDRPGTLAKVCRSLAQRAVNIVAFQAVPSEGKSTVRFVVDDLTKAKSVLNAEHLSPTEVEVVQLKLPHQPGELARAASRLGEANININYAYTGLEPTTNAPVMIFGVTNVAQAVELLDNTMVAAKA